MEIGDDFDSNEDIIYDDKLALPQLVSENDEVAAAVADPANWMRHMRKSIGSIPLPEICIPGSHDSATYGINSSNPHCEISPDFPVAWISSIRVLRPVFLKISEAQRLTIKQQLELGVRYLDLRVAPREMPRKKSAQATGTTALDTKQQLWIIHGLFSVTISDVIHQIKYFIHEHDYEILILDFQHFYNMTPELHAKLARKLEKHFGDLLVPPEMQLSVLPIKQLVADQKRIIVTYGTEWNGSGASKAMVDFPFLRHRPDHLHSPWPNTMSRTQLNSILKSNLASRSMEHLHCAQIVLTPQTSTAIAMKSLRGIAKKVSPLVHQWINEWHLSDLFANILMIDHVETCPEFVPAIIKINASRAARRAAGEHPKPVTEEFKRQIETADETLG